MKIINLFGSPGCGKSTTASGLFYYLKTNGYSVELVTEFAKDLVWSERFKCIQNQFLVTATQYERIRRLEGKVDFVITDSPFPLGIFYTPENYFPSFEKMVWEIFLSYDNYNIFLNRTKEYNPVGRMQTKEESDKISEDMKKLLDDNNIYYKEFKADEKVVEAIISCMKEKDLI